MMDLYWKILTVARCVGKAEGYAVGLHGSGIRDLDLIACPWTEEAAETHHFIMRFVDSLQFAGIDAREVDAVPETGDCWPKPCLKPHGRLAVTIFINSYFHVDLSIMPRKVSEA